MKIYNILFRVFSLFLLALITLLIGCSHPHKLDKREKALGTGGKKYAIFHRVAEADRGLGLRYPGFLIGIEKAYREKIGIPKDVDIDNLEEKNFSSEKSYKKAKKILDDRKRTFISHIIEYSVESEIKKKNKNEVFQTIPYVKEDIFYNVYSTDFERFKDVYSCENEYACSDKALKTLKGRIQSGIQDKERNATPYTHLFLYCMGWNTDQQESIRNYNSLLGLMIENYKGEGPFRPLFVGISWPSLWSWKVFKITGILASYFPKADDADEVGLIWGNKILRDILIPMKKEKGIPLVLIGHSLGARLLTRALFSSPAVPTGSEQIPEKPTINDVDLLVGLEGAFSVNRFIRGKGREGSPYEEYSKYAKKFVFTWSKHDKANPAAGIYGAKYIGGKAVYKYTKKKEFEKIFDHFTIVTDGIDNNYNIKFDEVRDNAMWMQSFGDQTNISIVDASDLIYFQPYLKGGRAHNDIYTPGIADFIWDCIDKLQNSETYVISN